MKHIFKYIHNKITNKKLFKIFLVFSLLMPIFFVFADGATVSIQSLSPNNYITLGTTLSFTIVASGFTNPSYSLSDSFSGGTASTENINSSGYFVWTPNSNDIGIHNLTVTASDSYGNSASASEQIIVSPIPSVVIQSLSPGSSVTVGVPVSFVVIPINFYTPTSSISDSFGGGTVSTANINSSGYFTWTPAVQDAGNHTITVTETDNMGHIAIATVTITVNQVPSMVIQSLTSNGTIGPGQIISFDAAVSGFSASSYSITDSFSGTLSSLSSSNISSSGHFTWIPVASDIGTHNIKIVASDTYNHIASTSQQIIVVNTNLAVQSLNPGTTLSAGTNLSFTVIPPTGFANPLYTATDSLYGSTISNTDINSLGYFNWVPSVQDIGSHIITIYATNTNGFNASTSIYITVNPQGQSQSPISSVLNQTTGQPSCKFTLSLKLGSKNADVTALQKFLAQQGYFTASATGYYGFLTMAAVKRFQAAHGIQALGVVGPATRNVLNQLQCTLSASTNNTSQINSTTQQQLLLQIQQLMLQLQQLQAQLPR